MTDYRQSNPDDETEAFSTNSALAKRRASEHACLVVLAGPELAKRFTLSPRPISIGRGESCDVRIPDSSVSKLHATIERTDDRFVLRDRKSTNGTYVNRRIVFDHALEDGDIILLGRIVLKYLEDDNIENRFHDEVYELNNTDALTQVRNRRHLLSQLDRELARSLRYRREMSLILFDVDHFKRVNDSFGHPAGDAVLSELAHRVKSSIRHADTIGRYGGEEFAIVAPEIGLAGGAAMGEKVRRIVAGRPFEFAGARLDISVSVGVADLSEYRRMMNGQAEATLNQNPDPTMLIELADEKLYRAKQSGRNCVIA